MELEAFRTTMHRRYELCLYTAASIALREISPRTPRQVLSVIPEEMNEIVSNHIFSSGTYEQTGCEAINDFLESIPLRWWVIHSAQQQRYQVTELGQLAVEEAARQHEETPTRYPHLTTIFNNILNEEHNGNN